MEESSGLPEGYWGKLYLLWQGTEVSASWGRLIRKRSPTAEGLLLMVLLPQGLAISVSARPYGVVIPTGFEPVADRLEICCSIQLSYGTNAGYKSTISTVSFQIVSVYLPYWNFLSNIHMKLPLRLEPVIDTVYKLVPARPARRLSEELDSEKLKEIVAENPAHFAAREALADRLVAQNRIEEACQVRLDGCMLVCELMDATDDEFVTLDWEDSYTAQALTMVYDSAEDHFMIGDFEMAAAMLELLQDRDPEDHLNASALLIYCYIALQEWELFDDTAELLAADDLAARLARYWADFMRHPDGREQLRDRMKRDDPALFGEWSGREHEISPRYQEDIASRRPSPAAQARRLWLHTEPLRRELPEFVQFLEA